MIGGDTAISVSLLIAVIGCLIGVYGFLQSRKKDTQEEDRSQFDIREDLLKANIKLDSVCSVTNEIRTDIKSMQNRQNQMDQELAIVKRDIETAFIRIDEIREMAKEKRGD